MFKRPLRLLVRRLFRNRVTTIAHGPARGLLRKGALGLGGPVPEPSAEERFLETLELGARTVYDIGAAEGLLTLFFARAVGPTGQVITFEPHPENRERTLANVALNGFHNVRVIELALGAGPARATMVVSRFSIGSGSLDAGIQAELRRGRGTRSIEVEVASLDSLIASRGLPPPALVKIDVEGLEHDVLRGMAATLARHRPALHIEMHGADAAAKRENAHRVLGLLHDSGYEVLHVELGRVLAADDYDAAGSGHLYCVPAAHA